MNNKERSLYSLFHKNTSAHFINGIHQYFVGKKINNLRANKVTKDEIVSMKAELINLPVLSVDMPLLVALFSVIVAVASNLYVPYINSLLPTLIKEEEHGHSSSDILQVLETCVQHLKELQNMAYIVLAIVVIIMIVKIILNIRKKHQLEALHEYERQLISEDSESNNQ